jgi:hypothetical protein
MPSICGILISKSTTSKSLLAINSSASDPLVAFAIVTYLNSLNAASISSKLNGSSSTARSIKTDKKQ